MATESAEFSWNPVQALPMPAGGGASADVDAERPGDVAESPRHPFYNESKLQERPGWDEKDPKPSSKEEHGFFSPELASVRREYSVLMARTTVMVVLLMWMSLPAFWGALSNSAKLTGKLTAWFIDRDNSRVGHALWAGFQNTTGLGWASVDPAVAGSNAQIVESILNNEAWIAVVIEANATFNLALARENGDPTYDPASAVTVYYAQARNEVANGNYVLPITVNLLKSTITGWATSTAQRYFAQITPGNSTNATAVQLLSVAPQTISPAIDYNLVNLLPYTAPAAQAVTLVGNIFLCIFAFFITMANSHARALIAPSLYLSSYFALRIIAPLIVYLPLSLSYTLVSLAFDLPFSGKYCQGVGFITVFAYVYLGMAALGLALESMVTILTPRFIPFFLFLLIIYNVAPVLMPVELQSSFFLYGNGFPIPNLSQAIRTIFFNTQSSLGRNAGVIIGWIVLSIGTMVIFTYLTHLYGRRMSIRMEAK